MKLNRNGYVNITALLLVCTVLLLIVSIVFAVWAYSGRQNYKNNTDAIVNKAVNKATAQQVVIDTNKFNVEQESSLTTYNGPSDYGSIALQYPKTWSAYVNTANSGGSGTSNFPLDGYFLPNYLNAVADGGSTNFALRIQVEGQSYSQILQQYDNQTGINVTPYALPKVPNDVGVEISGQIQSNISGTLVILPLRSQALEVWTEGNAFTSVFNSIILANLTFSP
jgi:hypothetical protein